MQIIFDRRRLLAATGLAAASSLANSFISDAQAGERRRGQTGPFSDVDQGLRQAVGEKRIPGVVALAAAEKGIIYEGAFGKRDSSKGPDMTPDTVFWLLSMTKAITATACMQLVEQGKLRLDEPIGEILPELKNPKVLEGYDEAGKPKLRAAKRPITLRHLLTHTSGYTYSIWSEALTEYETKTGMPDIATSRNAAFAAPLEFDPGDRWQYGISMDWVGKAVEAVSGQSLEIYFRENIFAPLGMKDTGFLIGSEQKRRTATLYNRQADGSLQGAPFEMSQRPEFFMGGGGLFGTPRDYTKFLQMLLRDGSLNNVQLLKPATVKSMLQNQIGDLQVTEMKTAQPAYSHSFDQFPGKVHKWGFSFDINSEARPYGRSAGSISWAGLLNCYFWLDPVKRVTGALFTQILPFYDPEVVKLYGAFEKWIYGGLARA